MARDLPGPDSKAGRPWRLLKERGGESADACGQRKGCGLCTAWESEGMKKPFWIAVGVGLAVIVGALLVAGLFLDRVVKSGIETLGPRMTGVTVQLRAVSLSPWSGQGRIEGLVIGNPEGYKTPHAIRVGEARMAVVPGSLWSEKLHIRLIEVESPEITVEIGPGGNNLKRILANVEAAAGPGDSSGSNERQAGASRKLQVDRLVIKGASFRLGATALGGSVPVRLPDIQLENLGAGPDGITPAELTQKIFAALVEGTAGAAQQAVGTLGKEAVRSAETLGKEAGEAAGKITRGLGELFKKKD